MGKVGKRLGVLGELGDFYYRYYYIGVFYGGICEVRRGVLIRGLVLYVILIYV